jgi:hypothetical protein
VLLLLSLGAIFFVWSILVAVILSLGSIEQVAS